MNTKPRPQAAAALAALLAALAGPMLRPRGAGAEQPPAPCHPNPQAAQDSATVLARGDVAALPGPLKDRLAQLADRPHSQLPTQAYAEADGASQLFQYYLLDSSGFEPNVFTTLIPGVNDQAQLTASGGNCGLPTVGSVRVVLEPKPGLQTDPNDPRAFIDIFTDISGLFVINNESGWYEGWMIHDLVVPEVSVPRRDGHAQFGKLVQADADALKAAVTAEHAAAKSLEIARRQLQLGAIHYLALLTVEMTYQQALIALVQARAARYADTAALFQALGGGWWNRNLPTRNS